MSKQDDTLKEAKREFESLNKAWWINASQERYGVTKAKAELLYEDIQNILEDKWEILEKAVEEERIRVADEALKAGKDGWDATADYLREISQQENE